MQYVATPSHKPSQPNVVTGRDLSLQQTAPYISIGNTPTLSPYCLCQHPRVVEKQKTQK